MGSNLSFCDLELKQHQITSPIQIVSSWNEEDSAQHHVHRYLKEIPAYSPVYAVGTLQISQRKLQPGNTPNGQNWELKLRSITCLNPFPKDIIVSKDAVWPAKSRHLQLRFDPFLRERLYFREFLRTALSGSLRASKFTEIETPILFKSTPEGAREFLVPTRRPGYAYALTQSPQQYKQILMAGGVDKYFQFAKCFRDEDHRADRQPEFTQLDIEMAFASGRDMRSVILYLVKSLCGKIRQNFLLKDVNGVRHPVRISPQDAANNSRGKRNDETVPKEAETTDEATGQFVFAPIQNKSYEYVMSTFGSDKPDLRIALPHVSPIIRISKESLSQDFIKMITSLEYPLVDSCNFRLGLLPKDATEFIRRFMDALPSTTIKLSPESTPAVLVYDSSKPLNGLSSLGHEAAQKLEEAQSPTWGPYKDGDIILLHARRDEPFYGGSTDLGRLRTAIHEAAVREGRIPKDPTFRFLIVQGFPLFTPTTTTTTTNGSGDDDGPGQGGAAGFSSTHHPFTAPLGPDDFDHLAADPLKARADHYDLVLNGVEVGGGSRRIHVAEVQEYVLREVLRMPDAGVAEFAHLLEALRAGCPPHAGFAFGFDRLAAVLLDLPSVRDVVAFPKSNKGEDLLVGSPSKVTAAQRKMYHILAADES
ncbi:hypothetical protein Hte_012485 [Hypoxylon texense]